MPGSIGGQKILIWGEGPKLHVQPNCRISQMRTMDVLLSLHDGSGPGCLFH